MVIPNLHLERHVFFKNVDRCLDLTLPAAHPNYVYTFMMFILSNKLQYMFWCDLRVRAALAAVC